MKVLIIEDEFNLADAIAASLQEHHYQTEIKTDGQSGSEAALSGLYDLVILDVMLPLKNGFEVLKEIRQYQPETKVIMLTAKGELNDKLFGLHNGANDYMTKPFHMEELLARVDVQLKNSGAFQDGNLKVDDLELDVKTGNLRCTTTGESIPISGKEYAIVEYIMQQPLGQILSKDQIYNKVWGWDNEIESNNLEAYISFIRKKMRMLGTNLSIKAVRGLGYKLEKINA